MKETKKKEGKLGELDEFSVFSPLRMRIGLFYGAGVLGIDK